MFFAGICLITKDVIALSNFYQDILQTTSDCNSEIHQEISTNGASLSILKLNGEGGENPMDFNSQTNGNPNMSITFTVDNVFNEFERLKSLNIKIIDPPTVRPWGTVNMRFCDPDGNYVVFRSFNK